MKILAFVDMHGSHKGLEKIKEHSKHADIIVCAGDISIFGNNLDKLLFELNKLKKQVLIVAGNHEDLEDLSFLTKSLENVKSIDKRVFNIGNYLFLGYGGGGFSMVDRKFIPISREFEKKILKFKKENKDAKIILVTHAPPYKTNIDKIMDEHCGNKDLKNFIVKVKPDLVISGHLHETAGKEDRIHNVHLINPGPYGKIINI